MIQFQGFPKIPRLNRQMLLTEKIDGSNACVIVAPAESVGADLIADAEATNCGYGWVVNVAQDDEGWEPMVVAAQSRKRLIKPGKQSDNAGFAQWVRDNAQGLAETLGEGYHFGEWWGAQNARTALQEGEQKLSLFNVGRWAEADLSAVPGLGHVPILYEGAFDQAVINLLVEDLRVGGSRAHPGVKPEGVVVFHKSSGHLYKVLCESDALPKGVTTRMERDIDGNLR